MVLAVCVWYVLLFGSTVVQCCIVLWMISVFAVCCSGDGRQMVI